MTLSVDVTLRRGELSLDVAFEAGPGVTALVGPSGSGKSTTLAAIAGLLSPARGRIALGGRALFDGRERVPAHERRIGVVFQSRALFPHLSALENAAFGARGDREARLRRGREALSAMRVAALADRSATTLSGGEAQRVALARAVATDPEALLLDEPLTGLQRALRDDLAGELRALADALAIPVVWVTHDEAEVADARSVVRLGE